MKPKKLFSFVLAAAMTLSLLPTFTTTAETSTAATEKNITLGTSALKGGQQSNVYFGTYQQSHYEGKFEEGYVVRPYQDGERRYRVLVPFGWSDENRGKEGAVEEDVDYVRSTTAVQNGFVCIYKGYNTLPAEMEQYAYYNKEPIKWRVLDNSFDAASGATDETKSVFLLSDKNLDAVQYNEENTAVTWKNSTIRTWLNTVFFGSAFSASEQGAIAKTVLDNAGNDTTDKVFMLSRAEAMNADYGFADHEDDTDTRLALCTDYIRGGATTGHEYLGRAGEPNDYWLRSADSTVAPPYVYYNSGSIHESAVYCSVNNETICVRPAFNLNPKTVFFTAAAKGGKDGTVGTIAANADFDSFHDNDGCKLTIRDSNREFSVSETEVTGNQSGTVAFTYKGAVTGENEYISAMITDKNTGEVLYYGQLVHCTEDEEEKGTFELTLPSDIADGEYNLKLFNEQINGDYRTDFSSDFVNVSLSVEPYQSATEKSIALGYTALSDGNLEKAVINYIYYGTYDEKAIQWRILSTNGNSTKSDSATYKTANNATYNGDALFVVSENTILKESTKFGTDTTWQGSLLQSKYQQLFAADSDELKFVLKTTKADSEETALFGENWGSSELKDDTLFALSVREAEQYLGGTNDKLKSPDGAAWWLRTPHNADYVGIVTKDGNVDDSSPGPVLGSSVWNRPAFNLDLSSVLFTAVAKGGKNINVGTVSKIKTLANFNQYKLTMRDSARTFALTGETTVNGYSGGTVKLGYLNAKTGENEYISAMILAADGAAEYYGQLAHLTNESDAAGEVALTIPWELDSGQYTVYLFNEKLNGDYNADFSSAFQKVTLHIPEKKTPSADNFLFAAPSELIYDGSAKSATVTSSESGMGKITVKYYDENDKEVQPINVGKYSVKVNVKEGIEYAAATNITRSDWNFEIIKSDSKTTGENITVTYGDTLTLAAFVEASTVRGVNKVDFYVANDDDEEDAERLGAADVSYTNGVIGIATLEVETSKKQLKPGDNTIIAEYGGGVNLNGSEDNAINVTLTPKTVGLEWDGYSTRTYDGTASNVTASAIGMIGNDAVGVTVKSGNKINANPVDTVYLATATALTGADAAYYQLPSNAVQIYKIEPKAAEIEWTLPTDLTYDGNEKEVTATVKNAVSGDAVGVILSGNKGTAATAYTAKAEALDNVNYTLEGCTNLTRDWTILPKKINAALTIAAPAKNATPQTSIDTDEYTATVSWTPSVTDKFAANTEYTATVTIAPKPNYTLDGIAPEEYTVGGATSVTKSADENIVTAVFPKTAGNSGGGGGGGSSASVTYTVTFETNGGSTISSRKIAKNDKAAEPTEPTKEGYVFDGWYTDKKCTTAYDFETKVTKNITLYAKWVEDEIQEPSDDKKDDNKDEEQKPQESAWSNPFTDVKETDWFFDSIKYANENGLMSGMTSDTFAPHATLTRGMFATVLYRAAGEPLVDRFVPFADVRAYMYCTNAINWARRNNIVSGVTETEFAPDDNITREQIAVILYRYAEYNGYDVSVGADTNILSYTDYNEISEYAIPAVQYAVGSGLMKGKTESTFHPKDFATRAEIATVLSRFIEGNK